MAEIVYMPKLSDTMVEGVVAAWNKKVGDKVKEGEILAEIETDKATMEFESFYDGILLHIGVETGKTAPINSVLAIIGKKGEDVAKILKSVEVVQKEEEKEPIKEEKPVSEKEIPVTQVTTQTEPAAKKEAKSISHSNSAGRIFASPLAKKLASDKGIDLSAIQGSGENGRIVKRDIEHYIPFTPAQSTSRQVLVGEEAYTDEPVSQMRKTIAGRLAESKFSAPHFYLTMDIDMDNAVSSRKAMNAMEGVKISFNDMVIKAVAHGLRQNPNVNSSWMGDFIRRNEHIHIGVAVAVEEGLLVPVIKFADSKGLVQISTEVREFAQKAKDKKLQPSDWEGNTFTISNLGMFGIENFFAIINPPNAAILAIGTIVKKPVVDADDNIVVGHRMRLGLSGDHRVVDGATGARYLAALKELLETPC